MADQTHQELLNEFLTKWTIEAIENLTLKEYVGINNPNTFCQWVETKTKPLGSIKGMTSIKFGIYQRKNETRQLKNYYNNKTYSWQKRYGPDANSAFISIKNAINDVIKNSKEGKFEAINKIFLQNLFKWKIAFLYSNERLIPVFNHQHLIDFAKKYNSAINHSTPISRLQEILINNKPPHLDVYEFMNQFYQQKDQGKSDSEEKINTSFIKKRKKTGIKNSVPQSRTINAYQYVAEQRHNAMQNELMQLLQKQYDNESISCEENYVDMKLELKDTIVFFEIKTASYASTCIREALGQLLCYVFSDTDERIKRLIVIGQYPATEQDQKFITFLKTNLSLSFDYSTIKDLKLCD